MEFEALLTIGVIVVSFILFATEYLSVDHVAIGIIVVLTLFGVLSPEESLDGFSNSATLTVAAMFILGDALIKTGIIESIGPFFNKLISKSHYRSVFTLSALTGSISAFVNNTPVVATCVPIVINACKKNKQNPAKFLIPLSFAAMFGGTCTLIGTSTNLLVDGIARSRGLEGFSMFLFAPLGLIFFAVGTLYLMLFSKKLLPDRNIGFYDEEDRNVEDYLTEIKIVGRKEAYKTADKEKEAITIRNVFEIEDQEELKVKRLMRNGKIIQQPKLDLPLHEDDILLVQGNTKQIKKIFNNEMLEMTDSLGEPQFPEEETKAVEVIILPNSHLINQRLSKLDFFERYNSRVLAIRQKGKHSSTDLGTVRLRAGDILLLQTNERGYEMLYKAERRRMAPFLSLSESGIDSIQKTELLKVGLVIAAVITLASLNLVPLVTGAFAGIFLLVLNRTISMENAYQAIDWKVIFLLAGALCLGTAMEKSGLSEAIAGVIQTHIASNYGPVVVLSSLYLITSLLTETMSNNAAAALLAPIAISLSRGMQVDPIPLLLAITFAGSASFLTPIGYQTNTMVYSAGNYRFKDFTRFGLPLNFLFWLIATFLIPLFYPF